MQCNVIFRQFLVPYDTNFSGTEATEYMICLIHLCKAVSERCIRRTGLGGGPYRPRRAALPAIVFRPRPSQRYHFRRPLGY